MTTSTAEQAATDTMPAAPPAAGAASLPHPFVLEPGTESAAEGAVIGALPIELEVSVSVAGMPPMTLGTTMGKIGRIVAGPADEDGGYRDVQAYGPTMGEMARKAAEMLSGDVVPGLLELATEADAADALREQAAPADPAEGDEAAPGPRCCKDKSDERTAAAGGAVQQCPDGTGPLAGGEAGQGDADTPDSNPA